MPKIKPPDTYIVKKTGERVSVFQSSRSADEIIIVYKGKKYCRLKSILGDTLIECDSNNNTSAQSFPQNDTLQKHLPSVRPGTVFVLLDVKTKISQKVLLTDTVATAEYKRMGGSYYGAGVEVTYGADESALDDDCIAISIDSPLGKLVKYKNKNYEFNFKSPSGKIINYRIADILSD